MLLIFLLVIMPFITIAIAIWLMTFPATYQIGKWRQWSKKGLKSILPEAIKGTSLWKIDFILILITLLSIILTKEAARQANIALNSPTMNYIVISLIIIQASLLLIAFNNSKSEFITRALKSKLNTDARVLKTLWQEGSIDTSLSIDPKQGDNIWIS